MRVVQVRHIKVWSAVKVAAVVATAAVAAAGACLWMVWTVISRLGLVDAFCNVATEIGMAGCAFDLGAYRDVMVAAGLAGIFLLTVAAALAALGYNLISDLVGGVRLELDAVEDSR